MTPDRGARISCGQVQRYLGARPLHELAALCVLDLALCQCVERAARARSPAKARWAVDSASSVHLPFAGRASESARDQYRASAALGRPFLVRRNRRRDRATRDAARCETAGAERSTTCAHTQRRVLRHRRRIRYQFPPRVASLGIIYEHMFACQAERAGRTRLSYSATTPSTWRSSEKRSARPRVAAAAASSRGIKIRSKAAAKARGSGSTRSALA